MSQIYDTTVYGVVGDVKSSYWSMIELNVTADQLRPTTIAGLIQEAFNKIKEAGAEASVHIYYFHDKERPEYCGSSVLTLKKLAGKISAVASNMLIHEEIESLISKLTKQDPQSSSPPTGEFAGGIEFYMSDDERNQGQERKYPTAEDPGTKESAKQDKQEPLGTGGLGIPGDNDK